MAALLRLAAMLVLNAASFLGMRPSCLPGECHADATPALLPQGESGTLKKDNPLAATTSPSLECLMVSSTRSVRPSNHEAGLTGARRIAAQPPESQLISPLIPASFDKLRMRAGTQGSPRSLFQPEAAARTQDKPLSWIPAFILSLSKDAGTSGAMSRKPRP